MYDYLVMGAGLAGLTFASEASRLGRSVLVIEKDEQLGGLSRTLSFGEYRFDLGGHRFHSRWDWVTEWVREVVGQDLLTVARRSRIRLDGRYVDYPIQFPGALTALPPLSAASVLASYLAATARRNGHKPEVSFEDWVVRRFGHALYDLYFRPYTEKVWGIPCTELSSDWASQRIRLPSLAAAVKRSLIRGSSQPATLVSRFVYPSLGIGVLPERLAERAVGTGRAEIHLGSRVIHLEHVEPTKSWDIRFQHGESELETSARQVVSTVPLSSLVDLLPLEDASPGSSLDYRSLICVFVAVEGPTISPDTWTYFPQHDIVFGRLHEPSNWSPRMVPQGKTSLCAEIFCSVGDSTWSTDDGRIAESVVADLDRVGFVRRERVRDAWVARVPHAYPIYRIGYKEEVQRLESLLAKWPTLHLAGRTGSFRYMNMDEVIKEAVELAGSIA